MKSNLLILMSSFFCAAALAGPLQDDAAFIRQTLATEHPDLSFSTSPELIGQALDAMTAQDVSRDEAWRHLATLNPLFADAHLFVGYPDWLGDTAAHLQAGGGLFPFEVTLEEDGGLLIRTALGGGPVELAGARITAINGVPAHDITAQLLKRMHGDTPRFRANLLAKRWWLYHWKTYGAAAQYALTLSRDGRRWSLTVPASHEKPVVLQEDGNFERQFGFRVRADGAGELKVGSFDYHFKDRFLSLTQTAFAQLRQQNITTLYIDISANGGGDDAMWLDGLMPYLASRPYRTGSTYTKKDGSGEIQTWRQPQPDLLYKGKVVVVIGPSTYSSAILFANVMQDFGFATLAGDGNAARRTQSGGIRKYTLPNSGLVLWVPRFILDPPAGTTQRSTLLAPR